MGYGGAAVGQRSALHGAGEPGCELDPRSLEDPDLCQYGLRAWSTLVRFRCLGGPHAGGAGVEEIAWKCCTDE